MQRYLGTSSRDYSKQKSLFQQALPTLFKPKKQTWVKATSPRSLAGYAFKAWKIARGTLQIGYINEKRMDLEANLNGFYPDTPVHVYIKFSDAEDARSWIRSTESHLFQFDIMDNPSDPSKDEGWVPGIPSHDLGPDFHHEMYPSAIVLRPLSQNPRDNFTDACLKALLDRGIMAFSDRRTNSVLIPTSSTAFSDRLLQIIEDEADKSPLKHFIPGPLATEHPDQETCMGFLLRYPPSIQRQPFSDHSDVRHLFGKLFGDELGWLSHSGNPSNYESEDPYQSLFIFPSLGQSLRCLTAWWGHNPSLFPHEFFLRQPPTELQNVRPSPGVVLSFPERFPLDRRPEPGVGSASAPKRRKLTDNSHLTIGGESGKAPKASSSPWRGDGSRRPPTLKMASSFLGKVLQGSTRGHGRDSPIIVDDYEDAGDTIAFSTTGRSRTTGNHVTFVFDSNDGENGDSAQNPRTRYPTLVTDSLGLDLPTRRPRKPRKLLATTAPGRPPPGRAKRLSEISEDGDPDSWLNIRIPHDQLPILPEPTPEEEARIRAENPIVTARWFRDIHKCAVPEEEIKEVLKGLPQTAAAQKAFSDLREGNLSGPGPIVAALSNIHHHVRLDIKPDDAAVYVAPVKVKTTRLLSVADRCGNVIGRHRDRICAAFRKTAVGRHDPHSVPTSTDSTPEPTIAFPYGGCSRRLSLRAKFDDFEFKGEPHEDKRMPLVQAASEGGGATHVGHTAVVGFEDGFACIQGQRKTILPHGPSGNIHFPPLTRVAIASYAQTPSRLHRYLESIIIGFLSGRDDCRQLNIKVGDQAKILMDPTFITQVRQDLVPGADKEVLFICDATGVKNVDFPSSHSGLYWMGMADDLIGQHADIRMHNWHFVGGSHSNNPMVTKREVEMMMANILPTDRFIVFIGTTVAWANALRYLFEDDPPPKNIAFGDPFVAKILGIKRIGSLFPHIGVINHIGDISWVLQNFSLSITLVLLTASQSLLLKKSLGNQPLPADFADIVLRKCKESSNYCTILSKTRPSGCRNFWFGPCAVVVERFLDAGVPWSEMNKKVAGHFNAAVIRSFKRPETEEEHASSMVCILSAKEDGSGGDICRSIDVPDLQHPGIFKRDMMIIPNSMRSTTDFFGHFYLHEKTLALELISTTGQMFRNGRDQVFSISRPHWMVSASYAPNALKDWLTFENRSRDLHVWEDRELAYRQTVKQQTVRLVNTLKKSEILEAVKDGRANCVLHPLQQSYSFLLWDETNNTYIPLNAEEPWRAFRTGEIDTTDVEFVAPFVHDTTHEWGFLMFKYSAETEWQHEYSFTSPMVPRLVANNKKESFPWKHGANTFLCKQVTGNP